MRLRNLGWSNLAISPIGVGCMNFGSMCDQAATDAIVSTAFDLGVNFFDVADIYGGAMNRSEAMLGKALGGRRHAAIVATKFGAKLGGGGGAAPGGGSADYITRAVEASLASLGTDYLDLYQHHFPDAGTPVEETLRALDNLVRQGKVRHIGCSNYTGAMLSAASEVANGLSLTPFVVAQNRYSLLTRDIETDLVPVCLTQGVGVLPYFPLESGLLSGKYRKGKPLPEGSRFAKWRGGGSFASEARYEIVERLAVYGDARGRSVLDLAIGWLVAQPAVASVIAGVTRPEQLVQNVAAGSWEPAGEELAAISAIAAQAVPA
ncbi:MAG: aldo/keto reductase [Gammaproteobacteria bacterium]|nr:aldo/keto reductase [Gammaproteobacteria bacterium]